MSMDAACSLTSDCLGLPSSPRTNVSEQLAQHAAQVSSFRARPQAFFAHWGGATGLANKLVGAAKRHSAFAAVIDIGCNTGAWSRMWLGRDGGGGSSKTGRLLCVEALPALAAALTRNMRSLPGGNRTSVLNLALSNVSGAMPLFGLPSSRGEHARTQTGAGLSRVPSEVDHVQLATVQVQTLDSMLLSQSLMDTGRLFVKVDTEGYDVHVLLGAACALQRGAIDGACMLREHMDTGRVPTLCSALHPL
jgi:FkbM family methyltransferase